MSFISNTHGGNSSLTVWLQRKEWRSPSRAGAEMTTRAPTVVTLRRLCARDRVDTLTDKNNPTHPSKHNNVQNGNATL